MKSLYYRSQKVSDRSLLTIAAVTILVVLAIRLYPRRTSTELREAMLTASHRTQASFEAIHCRRIEAGHKMLRSHDPLQTGMLGPSMSLVTTLPGHLDSKQTSVNPNFAAVAVRLLADASVRPGDRVAIGMTGSFPALNIAVLQAAEAMRLRPIIVSSAASSQYGANDPEMMWPDMERLLIDEGLLSTRSLMTSLGGVEDSAEGMTDETYALLIEAIRRSEATILRTESLEDSIIKRMNAFDAAAAGDRVAAYVNVGGGAASIGGTEGNEQFGSGVIWPSELKSLEEPIDCVAYRYLRREIPVVNMIHAVTLARRHGLAVVPVAPPRVGDANVFDGAEARRSLAAAGIVVVLVATWLAVRPPYGLVVWMRRRGWHGRPNQEPRWMV